MIISYAVTDVGRTRAVNQDYIFSCQEPIGNLQNLFIVADGMGGHRAGDFASSYCVRKFLESASLSLQKNPYRIFEDAIRYANNKLLEKAKGNPELKGMGTTIVALTIKENTACVANVGDSRLYHKQKDSLQQITVDHSLVQELINLGGLTPESARNHPDKNVITRAIGAIKDVEMDYFEFEITKDSILLMCSDGLSNMVEDPQLKEMLRYDQPIEKTVTGLVAAANENGGKDNIAVIVIKPEADEV